MTDIKLDALTGDIDLSTGRAVLISAREAARQQLALRLSLRLGEWFLDESQGVDFFGLVYVRAPRLGAISASLRERILTCPGITGLSSFELAFTAPSGELRLDFIAVSPDGEIAVTAQGTDFDALMLALLLQPIGGILS